MKDTGAGGVGLDGSYRGRFPFRIATTSFIYPDRILPNIRKLAPYFDEIEVLFFEKDSPPSAEEIQEVAAVLAASGLTVNVHLPLDVALASPDEAVRRRDAALVKERIEQTQSWQPTSYCLHLTPAPKSPEKDAIEAWRRRAAESLTQVLHGPAAPETLTVETLDYPFDRAAPLVDAFGLAVCMDLGHLFVHGFDPLPLYARFAERISVIHLHGVADGRDHLPLDRMAPARMTVVEEILKDYTGTVSLEVFSRDALHASIRYLDSVWGTAP